MTSGNQFVLFLGMLIISPFIAVMVMDLAHWIKSWFVLIKAWIFIWRTERRLKRDETRDR